MSQEPRCPKCHTVVQPSWDWCMGCGYDPAGRRPDGEDAGEPAGPGPQVATRQGAAPEAASRDGAGPWTAPAPLGAVPPAGPSGTRVTTLVGPGAAQPQEMRDPDWVQAPPHRRLPIPALIGLLAVVAAAIGALVVVTLLVLHRPIGTTGGGNLQRRPAPVTTSYWLTRGPS
jgi:hypothetical protein